MKEHLVPPPLAKEVCRAFDIKPYQIGLTPVPRRVRAWWRLRGAWLVLAGRAHSIRFEADDPPQVTFDERDEAVIGMYDEQP